MIGDELTQVFHPKFTLQVSCSNRASSKTRRRLPSDVFARTQKEDGEQTGTFRTTSDDAILSRSRKEKFQSTPFSLNLHALFAETLSEV